MVSPIQELSEILSSPAEGGLTLLALPNTMVSPIQELSEILSSPAAEGGMVKSNSMATAAAAARLAQARARNGHVVRANGHGKVGENGNKVGARHATEHAPTVHRLLLLCYVTNR
eukprot:3812594-Pyramimonas_sp.AAC.1